MLVEKPSVRRPSPLFEKWMLISGRELSDQSRKLLSDFVQSFQSSFVIFHVQLAMRATRPINPIVLSNLGDFSSKPNETFDDVLSYIAVHLLPLGRDKSKDTRTGSTKRGDKGQPSEQRGLR